MLSVHTYQPPVRLRFASETITTDTYQTKLKGRQKIKAADMFTIENMIRNRIFKDGRNALMRQMARARNYPHGFFRYDTGQLYRGFEIKQSGTMLKMIVVRNDAQEIINSLENHYGRIFAFASPEKTAIDKLLNKYSEK